LPVVGAVSLALVVAACGSSSKSTSGTTASASTAAAGTTAAGGASSSAPAAATGAPIKLGIICDCSGAGTFSYPNVNQENVSKAWVAYTNAQGGINGHPVDATYIDTQTNPANALTAAKTLIADHVVAITSISSLGGAFDSTIQASGIPVVGSLTIQADFQNYSDFYSEGETNDQTELAIVEAAKAAGATNFGNVYCAEVPICAALTPPFVAAGKQEGVPDLYNASIAASAPNYTAQCLVAKQEHLSAMFVGEGSAIIARVASDCAAQGYTPIWLTNGAGWGSNTLTAVGLKNHTVTVFPVVPDFANIPAVQTADAAIDKYSPGTRQDSQNYLTDSFMSWVSGMLLTKAVTNGGLTASATPTSAEIVQGLDDMNGETLNGLTVPLTYHAGQINLQDCYYSGQVVNGVASINNNGQPICPSS
jgi:branched-chain amino acid transport system substrate-binding protein